MRTGRWLLAVLLLLGCGDEIDDDCDASDPCKEAAEKFFDCCSDPTGGLDWDKNDDRCEGAKRLTMTNTIQACEVWAGTPCEELRPQCSFAPN